MLPERLSEMLSAYLDGELSARERRNVSRLLRKSSEARQLLHKLKHDSMILQRLPRRKTQIDLTESAMGTISLRGIQLPKIEPSPALLAPPPPPRKPWKFWLRLAVYVVLVLAAGLVSYLIVAHLSRPADGPTDNGQPVGPHTTQPTPPEDWPERPPPAIAVVHEPESSGMTLLAAARNDDRFGRGLIRTPPLVAAQSRLMLILSLRELEAAEAGRQVLHELKRDAASRIDLFCQTDTNLQLDPAGRLRTVLEANKIALRLDAYAQTRHKQRSRTNYALYCEELTPADWGVLIEQLTATKPAGAFDKLAINPLTPAEMAKVLGGEPQLFQRAVDPTKDPTARTGDQLLQTLSGQGGPPADPTRRQAVCVPYLPQPGFSPEVRSIVEHRKGWRPGAVQVLLVLWNP